MEKTCKSCGNTKPLSEFHLAKNYKYGVNSVCKGCKLTYSRRRDSTARRKKQVKDYWQSERGKEVRRIQQRRYYRENKEKVMAKRLVSAAIINGTLIREKCEVCGNTDTKGHHDDYNKPLEVRWLCQKHHSELHRR